MISSDGANLYLNKSSSFSILNIFLEADAVLGFINKGYPTFSTNDL